MSDSGQRDSDSLEIEMRPVEQIARRLLVLQTIADRVALEGVSAEGPGANDDTEALRFDQTAPLHMSGAFDECTDRERDFLMNPSRATSYGDVPEFTLAGEALEALLTVCGIGQPTPPPPQPYAPVGLNRSRLELSGLDSHLAKSFQRLEPEAIANARELAELWHWRALTELDIRVAESAGKAELLSLVREVTKEAVHSGIFSRESANDFDSPSTSVSSWSDDELMIFTIASEARLKALNWLCGFGVTWDNVPLDV